MKITKEQLKQIIKEELDEMRVTTVSGYTGAHDSHPPMHSSPVEGFLKKYPFLEKDIDDDGQIVIYFDDAESNQIKAKDVPEKWDRDQPGAGRYVYQTGEYEK